MRIKNKTAVVELTRHLKWIEKQSVNPDHKPFICHHVQDIITACLHVVNDSPTVDLGRWIDRRRNRRRTIRNCKQVYQARTANLELCRLVRLAISTLEADRTFRPEVFVGPLPIREPRTLTPDHIAKMQAARTNICETRRRQYIDRVQHELEAKA